MHASTFTTKHRHERWHPCACVHTPFAISAYDTEGGHARNGLCRTWILVGVVCHEILLSTPTAPTMLVTIALLLSLNAASAAFLSGAGVAARRGNGPAISAQSGIAMVAKQTPHGGKL